MAQFLNIPESLFVHTEETVLPQESLAKRCYEAIRDALLNRHSAIPMFYYSVIDQEPYVAFDQIRENATAAIKGYNAKIWLCAYDIGATLDRFINNYYDDNPQGEMDLFEAAALNSVPHTVARIGDRVYGLFKDYPEAL